jgi:hypothetical protein
MISVESRCRWQPKQERTMRLKTFFLFSFWCCITPVLSAQGTAKDYLPWSNVRKLTVDDFVIKTKSLESTSSFAQFTITFESIGFGFFTKNFNKKVHNYFLPGASWIDTTTDVAQSLRYQQTLFDLAEIYTRQMRKALRENRSQFLKNGNLVTDLNNQFMAAFANRRVAYDSETRFGTNAVMQEAWETQIQKELAALADFSYDR